MANANKLGEKYRQLSFVEDEYGNNFGCYNTFEVHPDFKKLTSSNPMFIKIANIINFNNNEGFLNNSTVDCVFDNFVEYKNIERYNSIFYNKKLNLYMGFYWDGDGTLVFIDKKNRIIINNDCKKDYIWNFI